MTSVSGSESSRSSRPPERLSSSENRRHRLASLNPPFLHVDLNEWSGDGKNFINGVLRRLHPDGPHPGLSDEEDSTFRLHLMILIARLLLRRLPV